jgi:hypothetical protein
MKTNYLKLLSASVGLCAALPLFAAPPNSDEQTTDFPATVKYELGSSEFAPGDSITIEGLSGTTNTVTVGETYCVTGTYTLNSQDEADLSFFATTTNRISTRVDPKQTMHVKKGTGSFRLIKRMGEEGYLHVTFYSRATGQGFGGIYFGQGQWVLRKKRFHYRDVVSRAETPDASGPVSFTGPNQVLFEYLGNPVPAPANLDAAYTREGLTRAMQTAARDAGVSLVKLEIDDSEFPFLVGVVFAERGEKAKFLEQVGKVAAYGPSGGVGDGDNGTCYAMNIIPYSAFPSEAGKRIYRRMMLRESVLFDKIKGTH